jgi:hypothetical protein
VVWAVDGGAVRYFGNAFVVDLLGLNSAEMLGPGAQAFLDRHPPRYIESVPARAHIDLEAARRLSALPFQPFTPYTATSFEPAKGHWVILCHDPSVSGQVVLRRGAFSFRCGDTLLARDAPGG